jgi:hypothetical protein
MGVARIRLDILPRAWSAHRAGASIDKIGSVPTYLAGNTAEQTFGSFPTGTDLLAY